MKPRTLLGETRAFTIYSKDGKTAPQLVYGEITGLDAFAQVPNLPAGTSQLVHAMIYIDVAENGGYISVRPRMVINDNLTGVDYGISKVDAERGQLILTVAQGGFPDGTTPPTLPPTS